MRAHDRAGRGSDPTEREGEELSQGSDARSVAQSRAYFHELTRAEQALAICRLIDDGMSEYGAAAATGISVEQIRAIVAERATR